MDPIQAVSADIPAETQQLDFLNLLNVAMDKAAELKERKKFEREKLEAEFLQDDQYASAVEAIKEQQLQKSAAKKRLILNPICSELKENIKNLSQQIREENQTTNITALQYKEKTGVSSFIRNGREFVIVQVAKFQKARKKRNNFFPS